MFLSGLKLEAFVLPEVLQLVGLTCFYRFKGGRFCEGSERRKEKASLQRLGSVVLKNVLCNTWI